MERTKGINLLIGILLSLCFLAGCNSDSGTEAPERIFSQRFSAFCRIGDNSYFLHLEADGMQYLYYYDRESNTASPLCGKAECTHNTPECSACAGDAIGMGSDGKYIYWVTPSYTAGDSGYMLYRINEDGTKRKCLRKLSEINENFLPTANLIALYDSENAYMSGQKSKVTDGEPIITTALYVFPMESREMKVLYEEEYPAASVIQIYGKWLYLSLTRQIVTEEDDKVTLSSEFELRRYDMETWEEEVLFSGKLDYVPYTFFVTDDRILITPVSEGKNLIYAYSFEKRDITPELCFDENEEYDVLFIEENRVIGYTYPAFPDFSWKKLKVTDYGGKIELEAESEERMRARDGSHVFGRTFYGCDETGMYFSYIDNESEPGFIKQRVVRIDLSDGSETELTGLR